MTVAKDNPEGRSKKEIFREDSLGKDGESITRIPPPKKLSGQKRRV